MKSSKARNKAILIIIIFVLAAAGTILYFHHHRLGRMKDYNLNISWEEISPIPAPPGHDRQFGLASPFAGTSNGVLIVTGGANFPDVPIAQGGKKAFHDDIFILEGNVWKYGGKAPVPAAYGATATIPDGVLCIGGRTYSGLTKDVFLLRWNPSTDSIETEVYPSLPKGIENFGAAVAGNVVYVAGGATEGVEANTVLSLDLSKKGADDFAWKEMEPFPDDARVQPVVVAQNDGKEECIFLIGGSCYPATSEKPIFCKDVLKYSPSANIWSRQAEIKPDDGKARLLRGSCGAAVADRYIVCVGGVNEERFATACWQERNGCLPKDYFLHTPEWFNFSKEVLIYDAVKDVWSISGEFPFSGPAGAGMVASGDSLYVINGEVMPGIRTDKVYLGKINNK